MPVPASFDATEMIRAIAEQLDALAQALEALALRVTALETVRAGLVRAGLQPAPTEAKEAKVKKVTT